MPNPYPANIEGDDGTVKISGQVEFTDPANQPGGSSAFVPTDNWCKLALNPAALTVASPSHYLLAGDLAIDEQSGTDFSIGESDGHGALLSAAGGWFASSLFVGAPATAALDVGSAQERLMQVAYSTGDPGHDRFASGFDAFIPVINALGFSDLAVTNLATPGQAPPGGVVIYNILVELINGFGTDEVASPWENGGDIVVWQIA